MFQAFHLLQVTLIYLQGVLPMNMLTLHLLNISMFIRGNHSVAFILCRVYTA